MGTWTVLLDFGCSAREELLCRGWEVHGSWLSLFESFLKNEASPAKWIAGPGIQGLWAIYLAYEHARRSQAGLGLKIICVTLTP